MTYKKDVSVLRSVLPSGGRVQECLSNKGNDCDIKLAVSTQQTSRNVSHTVPVFPPWGILSM